MGGNARLDTPTAARVGSLDTPTAARVGSLDTPTADRFGSVEARRLRLEPQIQRSNNLIRRDRHRRRRHELVARRSDENELARWHAAESVVAIVAAVHRWVAPDPLERYADLGRRIV